MDIEHPADINSNDGLAPQQGAPRVTNAVHHARDQHPSPGPAPSIPPQLTLVCGTATGMLDMESGRITHNGARRDVHIHAIDASPSHVLAGQPVSAPEFERLGGKASAKKWKASIRVDSPSGTPIGDWLQEHGLDLRNGQIHRVDSTTRRPRNNAPRPQGSGLLQYLKLPPMHHFDVGALPGDPSAAPLPRSMPSRPAQHATNLVVNLHTTHPDDLHAMAAASAQAPLRGMLPFAPCIPHDRMSFPTGRTPRPWPSAQDKAHWQQAVQAHIGGEVDDIWPQLGLDQPCTWPDGATPVDLRGLAKAVNSAGGFASVEQGGRWGELCASQLGVDLTAMPNAPRMARSLYINLLLGLEQADVGAGGGDGGGQATSVEPVVMVSDEDDPFRIQ